MPRPATSRATWRNRWRRASPDIPPTGLAKGRVRCDRDAYTGGMSDTQLLLLLLVAVCAAIVLLVVLLLRKPGRALEAALREEQRVGRGELRQQLDSPDRHNVALGKRLSLRVTIGVGGIIQQKIHHLTLQIY